MSEKQITSREKATDSVIKSVVTHSENTGQAWIERYSPYLEEGETMPDMALAMRLVTREMGAKKTIMANASTAHEAELADDAKPRQERDQWQGNLIKKVVSSRDSIESVLGRLALRSLGVSGRTPSEPVALIKTAKKLVDGLEDEEVKLPEPRVEGVTIDRVKLAEGLRKAIDPLQKALDAVGLEERQAEATQTKKWEAITENDETFGNGARWLEQTYNLVGKTDIARRVRSSKRRPGRLVESDENQLDEDEKKS